MIGAAVLPKAMGATPAPSSHAHAQVEAREGAMPAPPHAPGGQATPHRSHRAERDATQDRDAAREPADGTRSPDAKATAARRTAHAGRQPRGPQDDGDAPHDDAFARLLEPERAGTTPATEQAPAAATPSAGAPAKTPATAALPDQLLGLLASLMPGANASPASTPAATAAATQDAAAPANAAPTAALRGPAAATPVPQATTGAPSTPQLPAGAGNDKAAAGNGDALATLSIAPPGKDGIASPATATHADTGVAPAPASHAAVTGDAPAAAGFDALLHAPATAPAPVADTTRPLAVAPAPLAQPADPRAGYGDDFGGNVVWMAEQRLGHAQLHVSPDHLGPIEVRLQLDGTQVQASFLSAQPDVRHALEASLPRLRELLGQHGLQLAQADVGQRQPDPRGFPMQRREADGRDPVDDGLTPTVPTGTRVLRGLLDEYA